MQRGMGCVFSCDGYKSIVCVSQNYRKVQYVANILAEKYGKWDKIMFAVALLDDVKKKKSPILATIDAFNVMTAQT